MLAALAGRIYDHAPQQNAFPLGRNDKLLSEGTRPHMRRAFVILLAGSSISLRAQASQRPVAESVGVRHAIETATRRMQAHGNDGFSVNELNRTRDWFSPELFSLLLRDMSDPNGPGYLNWDPFTAAQDDVGPFRFDSTSRRADTVFVAFSRFDSYDKVRVSVILGMRQVNDAWRIATFVYPSHSSCYRDLAHALAITAADDSAKVPLESRRCRN